MTLNTAAFSHKKPEWTGNSLDCLETRCETPCTIIRNSHNDSECPLSTNRIGRIFLIETFSVFLTDLRDNSSQSCWHIISLMHFVNCWRTVDLQFRQLCLKKKKKEWNDCRTYHTGLELISNYIMPSLQCYFRAVKSANINQTSGYLIAVKVCWLVNTKYWFFIILFLVVLVPFLILIK
jgi:hypothetical protein